MIGCVTSGSMRFLSTLPARGATTRGPAAAQIFYISIHAPREGSDFLAQQHPHLVGISIHAPREGSDGTLVDVAALDVVFLSTLPARGATGPKPTGPRSTTDFYPRSPRGERHTKQSTGGQHHEISIHAPREGSDNAPVRNRTGRHGDFYPRSPRGERRRHQARRAEGGEISIHAPREGSDDLGAVEEGTA